MCVLALLLLCSSSMLWVYFYDNERSSFLLCIFNIFYIVIVFVDNVNVSYYIIVFLSDKSDDSNWIKFPINLKSYVTKYVKVITKRRHSEQTSDIASLNVPPWQWMCSDDDVWSDVVCRYRLRLNLLFMPLEIYYSGFRYKSWNSEYLGPP